MYEKKLLFSVFRHSVSTKRFIFQNLIGVRGEVVLKEPLKAIATQPDTMRKEGE